MDLERKVQEPLLLEQLLQLAAVLLLDARLLQKQHAHPSPLCRQSRTSGCCRFVRRYQVLRLICSFSSNEAKSLRLLLSSRLTGTTSPLRSRHNSLLVCACKTFQHCPQNLKRKICSHLGCKTPCPLRQPFHHLLDRLS